MPETDAVVETPQVSPHDSKMTDELTGLTKAEYNEWRLTGKVPEAKSEETPSSPAAETPETPAASEPAKAEEEGIDTKRAKTARRFNELLEKNRQLEARLAALEGKQPAEEVRPPAADRPTTEQSESLKTRRAQLDKDLADGKYTTYEGYLADVAQAIADDRIEHRLRTLQAQTEQQKQAEANQRFNQEFAERYNSAKDKHADFDEVVGFGKEGGLGDKRVIPAGSVAEAWIMARKLGPEVAYYLGGHREELADILQQDPLEASARLALIEAKINPDKPPSAPPKSSKAPGPAHELGSGRMPPPDEIEHAIRTGDTRAAIRAMNAKAIADARAGRG